MSAVSALRKYVMSEAPGCPAALIDRAIVKSARDLCDKTYCWKSGPETASMQIGVNEIAIVIPPCADLVALEYVKFNGAELHQTTERELSACDIDWRTTTGDPSHVFTAIKDGKMRLYPTPNRNLSDAIQYEVYVKPKADETEIEDFLAEQFVEVLQHGALYELLRMSNRPWSNPQLAVHYRTRYRHGVYEARDKTVRQYASQNLNIIPEPLF